MLDKNAQRPLDYVPITGPGVDALERRKEHNNNPQVTAAELRTSINNVKQDIFSGMKMLIAGAAKRVQAK